MKIAFNFAIEISEKFQTYSFPLKYSNIHANLQYLTHFFFWRIMRLFSGGNNDDFQLCRPGEPCERPSLVHNLPLDDIKKINLGYSGCVAIYEDGSVYKWGRVNNEVIQDPTKIEGLPIISDAICNFNYLVCLTEDGKLLVDSQESNPIGLYQVETDIKIKMIFGRSVPCVVGENKKVYSLDFASRSLIEFQNAPDNVKQICSISTQVLLISRDGKTYISKHNSNNFTLVESLRNQFIVKIDGCFEHFVAVASNGKAFGNGCNIHGTIGTGQSYINLEEAQKFHEILNFPDPIIDIATGDIHTLFLDIKGKLWQTGKDHRNQKMGDSQHNSRKNIEFYFS
ncbi:hypothetical protein TRFO_07174 [Tritrichomonas foetus]|uniref:Regulator of chromosome condensation n=1 Tax=Tritrichomonas foetus TaxID=1144522 RepID=A0A1J4JT84_9EUKA|nr:hypothetical protein TRFO_07174 [Tritrichomonas foetus]|eukprot:OHT02337.1 hypothetical protein TRFO_07174 [Tritrichomonas foetus]